MTEIQFNTNLAGQRVLLHPKNLPQQSAFEFEGIRLDSLGRIPIE